MPSKNHKVGLKNLEIIKSYKLGVLFIYFLGSKPMGVPWSRIFMLFPATKRAGNLHKEIRAELA